MVDDDMEHTTDSSSGLLNRPATPPKLLSDGSRPRKRPRVAMGKGMKGLRGYVKPQDTPFASGYTNVHPPVRLAAIGAWQRARRATPGWILQWGFSTGMFVRYISVIARGWERRTWGAQYLIPSVGTFGEMQD